VSTATPERAFIADPLGQIEVVDADDPRKLDLGATQPIDIPLDAYVRAAATTL
jgi:hypothetical protein